MGKRSLLNLVSFDGCTFLRPFKKAAVVGEFLASFSTCVIDYVLRMGETGGRKALVLTGVMLLFSFADISTMH